MRPLPLTQLNSNCNLSPLTPLVPSTLRLIPHSHRPCERYPLDFSLSGGSSGGKDIGGEASASGSGGSSGGEGGYDTNDAIDAIDGSSGGEDGYDTSGVIDAIDDYFDG